MNLETRLKIQKHIRRNYVPGQQFTARGISKELAERFAYSPVPVEVAMAIKLMPDVEIVPVGKRVAKKQTAYQIKGAKE